MPGTGEPRLPRVRALTDDEKREREVERRRAALGGQLRRMFDARSGSPATMSRFDMLADALMNTIVDQLFDAVNSPGFAEALTERGYAVAVLPDGDTPTVPDDWSEAALDLFGFDGELTDAVGAVEDLWQRAYLAGYAAADGQRHLEDSTSADGEPRPPLLDLTSCPGCGFSKSGINAGCAECARRHPDRYAAWAKEMSDELDELRRRLRAAEAKPGG